MTRTGKIQENLDDEVHCWSQVPRAGSVTTNVSLKFLWKDKTHDKKKMFPKRRFTWKILRLKLQKILDLDAAFSSCRKASFAKCIRSKAQSSSILATLQEQGRFEPSNCRLKEEEEENGRKWKTMDDNWQDTSKTTYLPPRHHLNHLLPTNTNTICIPNSELCQYTDNCNRGNWKPFNCIFPFQRHV